MKALFKGLMVVAALSLGAAPALGFDQTHKVWSEVLGKYQTSKGLMRYGELKADLAKEKDHPFRQYLTSIEKVGRKEFDGWQANEKKAFLINAYNSLTVKLILEHYPVKSIKDIGSFFKKPWSIEFFSLLGGAIKSLDPIEHEWLRPKFMDYRVHAAVNCASISCPPLRHEAFVADRLDAQLDEQMKAWLSDPTRNRFDAKKGVLKLSKIFDWYGDDFEKWGGGVKKVVEKFGPEAARAALKKKGEIEYLDYNWGLNSAKASKSH